NCHRALLPAPTGIHLLPYDHVSPQGAEPAYLPFWRFDARIDVPAAPPLASLEDYAKAVFPQGLPPGFSLRGPHLWVPAFRLLGTEDGDEAFQDLTRWLQGADPQPVDGKIPLGIPSTAWGVSVPESEALELAPLVLFALHGKASAARLNTRVFTSALTQAKLTLT